MKQKYELGQKVYVFRANKGELHAARGIVHVAEVDKSGYILYTIQVEVGPDQKDTWRANHASIALSEEELKVKMDAYEKFNQEQKEKYNKIFGSPDFNPEDIGL